MRYRIAAVGSLRRGFLRTGCEHYLERLRGLAPSEVIEVKAGRGQDTERVRAQEATALSSHRDGHVVALDERGSAWRTAKLADHVARLEVRGISRITLLIGGADGLAPRLRDEAHEVWRLSDLTLPHELARLVLVEQLYRIETVRAGHPYHRE